MEFWMKSKSFMPRKMPRSSDLYSFNIIYELDDGNSSYIRIASTPTSSTDILHYIVNICFPIIPCLLELQSTEATWFQLVWSAFGIQMTFSVHLSAYVHVQQHVQWRNETWWRWMTFLELIAILLLMEYGRDIFFLLWLKVKNKPWFA